VKTGDCSRLLVVIFNFYERGTIVYVYSTLYNVNVTVTYIQRFVGEWHPLYSAMPRIKILTSFEIRQVSQDIFEIISHYRYIVLSAVFVYTYYTV